MSKFKFPGLKIFILIFLLNILLFAISFIVYKNIKRSGYIKAQRETLSMIAMEVSSRISEKKNLVSRLAGIDFIRNFLPVNTKEMKHDISLQFETMKKSIGASVVFLMNTEADVIQSSTYMGKRVLTGNNSFRPYFKEAIKGFSSFYGAVGDATKTRGFYFSSPVKAGGKIRFILALKFILDEFDEIFDRFSGIGGLLTPEGIIFSANKKEWILKSLFPIGEKKLKSINDSRRFADKELGGSVFDRQSKILPLNGNEFSVIFDRSVPGGWTVFSMKRLEKVPFPFILLPVFFLIFIFDSLIYASIYNLRKRREAQRKYIESSDRFRYLFQSALDYIFILNSKGIIVDLNYTAVLKFGFSKEELMGRHFKRIVDKRSLDEVDKYIRIISTDLNTRFEFRAVTKAGEKVLLDCAAVVLKGRSGKTESYFAFCHDITKQRKFENDLKKAIRSAKRANKTKSEFLANMSHEIRTPMNAILGFADILQSSGLTKEQKNYLDIINESGRSLIQIIDDILDFSRIEAREIHFDNIPIDIRKISSDVINIINIGMNRGRIRLFEKIEDEVPEIILGDPLRLKQVLINLLSNAVKFTNVGDVKLVVKVKKNMGKWVSLYFAVSDTGIGIPDDDTDKLFKPFSQIDSSSSRKYKGTGLGLVITSSLVKKMGGEISVRSKKGEGSTFSFVLSFEKEERPVQKELISIEKIKPEWKIKPEKLKILIAEDQKVNSMLLDYILKREGFKTRIAENGIEAIKFVKEEKFDLILMDIQMPEMDGINAAKQIRKLIKEDIPIIALTADAMKGDRERFIKSGMDDYLKKPIGKNILLDTIRRWISKK